VKSTNLLGENSLKKMILWSYTIIFGRTMIALFDFLNFQPILVDYQEYVMIGFFMVLFGLLLTLIILFPFPDEKHPDDFDDLDL
jgi:hypothetical protein